MRAVVYGGKGIITVEDRPIPEVREEGDVVVKSAASYPLACSRTLKQLARSLSESSRPRSAAQTCTCYEGRRKLHRDSSW